MRFQTPLIRATLIRRYKRFLADCLLDDGREVVAHVANPGSMIGLNMPGLTVWLEPNDDPRKKLDFAWRLAEVPFGPGPDAPGGGSADSNSAGDLADSGSVGDTTGRSAIGGLADRDTADRGAASMAMVGVDTGAANRVVREALQAGAIPELDRYPEIRPEMRYTMGSRIDFLLSGDGRRDVYLEIKSVTLSRSPGLAEFPDSVTARGLKHLRALSAMAIEGHRAVMLYVVMRDDCTRLRLADDLDPAYAAGMTAALAKGVEVFAMGCRLTRDGITLDSPIALDRAQFGAATRLKRST